MEIFVIGVAFLFLVLMCGGALTFLSFIVFRDKANFNANMQTINIQMSEAYKEFQSGITANKQLAEDLNTLLADTQPSMQVVRTFEDRLKMIENTIKLKTTGSVRTGARLN